MMWFDYRKTPNLSRGLKDPSRQFHWTISGGLVRSVYSDFRDVDQWRRKVDLSPVPSLG